MHKSAEPFGCVPERMLGVHLGTDSIGGFGFVPRRITRDPTPVPGNATL